MKRHAFVALILAALLTGGCSTRELSNPTYWGVAGTALGAGTGALIGSVIANGDIGASAILGGVIGVGSGVLVGYMVDQWEEDQRAALRTEIRRNEERINQREREIQELHRNIDEESQKSDPDPSRREWLYDGPTLGLYYR